jgi:hypothetical protein
VQLAGCVACHAAARPAAAQDSSVVSSTRRAALTGGKQQGAREEGPAVGGRTRTSTRDQRAGQQRGIREARAGKRVASQRARHAPDQAHANSTSSRELEARGGEEAHGAWDGARDAEFGSARTLEEADVW